MTFWTAQPVWQGETCFIVCGGPSLIGFDFERLRGRRVIAINSSYEKVPFAEVLVFGDGRWWNWRRDHARQFGGRIVHCGEQRDQRLSVMRPVKPPGLQSARDAVTFRHTSLTAALNLAVHFGVSRIVLLGADMGRDDKGLTHHHAPHPVPSREGCWDMQMKDIETLVKPLAVAGVEVINASLNSRMEFWPRAAVEGFL